MALWIRLHRHKKEPVSEVKASGDYGEIIFKGREMLHIY